MLQNTKSIVKSLADVLASTGWDTDEHVFERFFEDEFTREVILKNEFVVGYCDELVVKFNSKDNEMYLETTWSNLKITNEIYHKISDTKGLIEFANDLLNQPEEGEE